MKPINWLQRILMLILLLVGAQALAAGEKPQAAGSPAADVSVTVNGSRIPLFSSRFADTAVAAVNDDPITLKELAQALASAHEERVEDKSTEHAATGGKKNYLDMLNRLLTVRLIVHEARNMGMDELAEVKDAIEAYGKNTLQDMVMERATEFVEPDASSVETLYRDLVKEYKIRSVLFEKEDIAKKASEEIRSGKDFDETVKKLVESHEARGSDEGKYIRRDALLPEIAEALSELKAGEVSPVIGIEAGYVMLKLEDLRMPKDEDPAAREQARTTALALQKKKALSSLKKALVKKYVKLNAKLLKRLNYESSPAAFEKLLKDNRVLAKIRGEAPITVGAFTKALKGKFFHGVEQAVKDKKVNDQKMTVLDEMISKRILLKEAGEKGLDRTDEYREIMKNYEHSALFDAFVRRAIIPGIKPKEEDLKGYYESHKKEYSLPRMVKLNTIAFKDKKRAEEAITRLRKGDDFKWLKTNFDGAVPDAGDIVSPAALVVVNTMPRDLQKAVDGAKAGDFRLYSGANGMHYAVLVTDVVPEKTQPFEEVRAKARTAVINEQLKKELDAWAAKLREAYTVKVYLEAS